MNINIQEVRARRADIVDKAGKYLEAHKDNWTASHGKAYDGMMAELAEVDSQIRERMAYLDGVARGSSVGEENWQDKNGSSIRVLSKNDRLATSGQSLTFGFGSFVKAMVTGSNNPDIRAALSEGTDSAGGYTVPKVLIDQLIDAMRSKQVCVQAGATTVVLEGAQNTIARIASDPVAGWRAENASVAESDPTFEGVVLAPKSLAVLVKVSRELLDDSLNLEQALMMAFAGALGGELDRVALFGTGTAPQPRGIANTSGINSVSMGTNGAQITDYSKLLDSLYEIELDNAAPNGMVYHPRTGRVINGFKDTTNQPLLPPPALANVLGFSTTSVPINQTQGTANNASSLIMGDFTQLLLGIRQELRVEVLKEAFAGNLQYGFIAHLRADVALAHPAAFCSLVGIIP